MQNKGGRNGSPLQKFRLSAAERLSEILKPDVLDDETRKQIVRDIIGTSSLMRDVSSPQARAFSLRRPSREGNYPAVLRNRISSGEADCVSAMARRLKFLETQLYSYRMELKEKNEKLLLAEANYEKEKARREEAESMVVELYDDKEEVERQVLEMQKFLADYGLKWVGEKNEGAGKRCEKKTTNLMKPQVGLQKVANHGLSSPSSGASKSFELYAGDYTDETPVVSRSPSPLPHKTKDTHNAVLKSQFLRESDTVELDKNTLFPLPVSIDVLKRHAKILSDHIGVKGVVTNGNRGSIKEREVVRIVVYKDGICVNGGMFRQFGCPLCDSLLKDIADGYYPYEFKQRYPDGFPIEIIDHTSVCAAEVLNATIPAANVKNLMSLQGKEGCGGYQIMSRNEFIRRLPVLSVTPTGRIVSVQEKMAHLVGVHTDKGIVRHVSGAEKRAVERGDACVCESKGDGTVTPPRRTGGLVGVLVRYPSGEKVVLNLSPESTIGELRQELGLAMPGFSKVYDIRLSYPAVTYSEDNKTLKELGLLTSCTLMIQPPTHAVKS